RTDNIRRNGFVAIGIAGGPVILDPNVAAVAPAQLLKCIEERCDAGLSFRVALCKGRGQHADAAHSLARLRACRQWPSARRASKKHHEFASSHIFRGSRSRQAWRSTLAIKTGNCDQRNGDGSGCDAETPSRSCRVWGPNRTEVSVALLCARSSNAARS